MIGKLISLITTFVSFIGLMLMGNNAMASPVENSEIAQASSNTIVEVVNLNLTSPFLQLNEKTPTSFFDHMGCSCGLCTQGTINSQSKI